MKNILKKIKFSLPLIFCAIPVFFSSSCSGIYKVKTQKIDITTEEGQAYKYINERSISLLGSSGGKGILGTAWYIDTVGINSYLFATNVHVREGIKSISAQNHLSFAKEMDITNPSEIKWSQYTSFSGVQWSDDTYSGPNNQCFADYCLFTASSSSTIFSSITEPTEVYPLNTTAVSTTNFYVAGYPGGDTYTCFNAMCFKGGTTWIDDHNPNYSQNVNSLMYVAPDGYDPYRLIGGSSGSMCVVKSGSSYKVAGIYWGYYSSSEKNQKTFQGAFDLLKVDYSTPNFTECPYDLTSSW